MTAGTGDLVRLHAARGLRRLGGMAAAWLLLVAGALAQGAPGAAEPRALDLLEDVQRIPVSTKNRHGLLVSGEIAVTSYRPPGLGPFPFVVMSHGRAAAERRAQQGRQRYEPLARYLVAKGFAVFVPIRLGYGDTFGQADPEEAGACHALSVDAMSLAASDQVLATVEHARSQPWVDGRRWVAIGQSVGGLATLAAVGRRPPGLVAAINFAGGTGGNPDRRPGQPCSPQRVEQLWREQAASSQVPTLWLYWRNDLYWGAEWPPRWAAAWREGGGDVEFHHLAAVGRDGHSGLSIDMDHWVPIVETFLARQGFTRAGMLVRPEASGFAAIDDLDRLPVGRTARELYETRFLAAQPPRAFAIGPGGVVGWAGGDWAMGRALGFCQRARGVTCKLYAVDDDVVWAR